jgi:serine/threonine protein kinase
MLASLNHSNMATIHSFEEFDGIRFIVMELLPGETLADRIDRGALSLQEALPILRQTAAALQAVHEKGIIHRDLKPANIQLLPEGTAKVLDFGLAKAADIQPGPVFSTIDTVDQSKVMIAGTPSYLSPEQVRSESLDTRVDIWAFGCVAYEALTGERVFQGKSLLEIAGSILNLEPDWSKIPATTPASIRSLIQRCMEKDRKRRLPDIVTARNEIEQALRNLHLPPREQQLWRATIPRLPVAALSLFVILTVSLGIWAYFRSTRARWAENALPEVSRLIEKGQAFRCATAPEASGAVRSTITGVA